MQNKVYPGRAKQGATPAGKTKIFLKCSQ